MRSRVSVLLPECGIYEYAHTHNYDTILMKLVRVCNVYLAQYPGYYHVIETLRERIPETSMSILMSDTTFSLELFQFLYDMNEKEPMEEAGVLLNGMFDTLFSPKTRFNEDVCVHKVIFWIDELLLQTNRAEPLATQLVHLANHLQISITGEQLDYVFLQSMCIYLPKEFKTMLQPLPNWTTQLQHQCNLILMGLRCLVYDTQVEMTHNYYV